MTEREKLAMLEELLELNEGELKSEMELSDVGAYDSMARLGLIVMMEDEFGVQINGETIKGFKKVRDILRLMEK